MTLSSLQAAATPRPQGAARVAPRSPALAGPRHGVTDRRIQTREPSTALPQVPAKFAGPEDFKAYLDVVLASTKALQAQAAGPRSAMLAAELSYKQQDEAASEVVRQARQELAQAKHVAQEFGTFGDAQLAAAHKALDDARHPGRGNAIKLQRELDVLQRRADQARSAIATQQALLDGGAIGPERASAYAKVAQAQHVLNGTQQQLTAKATEVAHERVRTAPDYDPHVRDAAMRLADVQQRLGGGQAEAHLEHAEMNLRCAQEAYESQVGPVRQELEQAKAAYAPSRAALEAARGRVNSAADHVTRTQRALWWARGFQVDRMVAEAAAQI